MRIFYMVEAMIIAGSALATVIGLVLCALERSRRVGVRIAILSGTIFAVAFGSAALKGSPELRAAASVARMERSVIRGCFRYGSTEPGLRFAPSGLRGCPPALNSCGYGSPEFAGTTTV
jgi:hypothetical protein